VLVMRTHLLRTTQLRVSADSVAHTQEDWLVGLVDRVHVGSLG
jgi:hypothetical protein